MAFPLTLAQMRDAIRRKLQIVPAIDNGGPSGAATSAQPDPNNATMNDAINDAIDLINQRTRIGKAIYAGGLQVPQAPSWLRGPYFIEYGPGLLDSTAIAEAIDAHWADNTGNVTRLIPLNYYAKDNVFKPFDTQQQRQSPTLWFAVGTQIAVLPPPSQPGTLYITHQEGIPPLITDTDSIAYLPFCFDSVVEDLAVMFLSARNAQDAEAADRFGRYQSLGLLGVQGIVAWRKGLEVGDVDASQDTSRMISKSEVERRAALGGNA